MPYNPAGLFSLVASYFANPGTTIRTEQHNPPLEDIASALSSVLIRDGRAPMTGPLNMNGFAITNVATGNTPGSVATLAQAMPIGAIIDFPGATPPSGWLLCYGQAVSRTTYATLFAIIGTTFGAGDGSATFNLPDLRGRVVAGVNNMGGTSSGRLGSGAGFSSFGGADPNNRGATAGSEIHTLTVSQLASHSHANTLNDPGHSHDVANSRQNSTASGVSFVAPRLDGGYVPGEVPTTTKTTGISISNAGNGGDAPHNNVQPTMVLNKIIKVSYDG